MSKVQVLTMGEGIAMVEEMDRSRVGAGGALGRGNLKRPSVTKKDGAGSLAIVAAPRWARE